MYDDSRKIPRDEKTNDDLIIELPLMYHSIHTCL